MTLVIAGHKFERDIASLRSSESKPKKMVITGLFVVSDSVITSNGNVLLSGFRKTYELPVKLFKPSLINGCFKDYNEILGESEVFVSFAGSTLVAQHVINKIAAHLCQMRISCEPVKHATSIKYKIIMPCEVNYLTECCSSVWGSDTFLSSDFLGLFTAELILEAIGHSITHGLESAQKYSLTQAAFEAMRAEFIAGARCPVTGEYRLAKYELEYVKVENEYPKVITNITYIPEGEIAVIGMSNRFGVRAQECFSKALSNNLCPAIEVFKFLNLAIDEIAVEGVRLIDRPSSWKELNHNGFEFVESDHSS